MRLFEQAVNCKPSGLVVYSPVMKISQNLFPFSLGTALLALALFSSGCLEKRPAGPVVARFGNDVAITEAEYKEKLENLPKGIQAVALANKKEFLEDILNEHLLLKEAQQRGLGRLPDVESFIETAKKKILVAKLVELEIDKKISVGPDDALTFYESHKEEFVTPVFLRASHILVKTEEEAVQIKNDLDVGLDFEEIARNKSLDATGVLGGDLGFFQKGQFVPEFEEAALELKKGPVSGAVKSRFGYHIIKLTDRMEPRLKEFKLVKAAIEDRLLKEKRSAAFKDLMEKLKNGKQAQVDEKALESVKL